MSISLFGKGEVLLCFSLPLTDLRKQRNNAEVQYKELEKKMNSIHLAMQKLRTELQKKQRQLESDNLKLDKSNCELELRVLEERYSESVARSKDSKRMFTAQRYVVELAEKFLKDAETEFEKSGKPSEETFLQQHYQAYTKVPTVRDQRVKDSDNVRLLPEKSTSNEETSSAPFAELSESSIVKPSKPATAPKVFKVPELPKKVFHEPNVIISDRNVEKSESLRSSIVEETGNTQAIQSSKLDLVHPKKTNSNLSNNSVSFQSIKTAPNNLTKSLNMSAPPSAPGSKLPKPLELQRQISSSPTNTKPVGSSTVKPLTTASKTSPKTTNPKPPQDSKEMNASNPVSTEPVKNAPNSVTSSQSNCGVSSESGVSKESSKKPKVAHPIAPKTLLDRIFNDITAMSGKVATTKQASGLNSDVASHSETVTPAGGVPKISFGVKRTIPLQKIADVFRESSIEAETNSLKPSSGHSIDKERELKCSKHSERDRSESDERNGRLIEKKDKDESSCLNRDEFSNSLSGRDISDSKNGDDRNSRSDNANRSEKRDEESHSSEDRTWKTSSNHKNNLNVDSSSSTRGSDARQDKHSSRQSPENRSRNRDRYNGNNGSTSRRSPSPYAKNKDSQSTAFSGKHASSSSERARKRSRSPPHRKRLTSSSSTDSESDRKPGAQATNEKDARHGSLTKTTKSEGDKKEHERYRKRNTPKSSCSSSSIIASSSTRNRSPSSDTDEPPPKQQNRDGRRPMSTSTSSSCGSTVSQTGKPSNGGTKIKDHTLFGHGGSPHTSIESTATQTLKMALDGFSIPAGKEVTTSDSEVKRLKKKRKNQERLANMPTLESHGSLYRDYERVSRRPLPSSYESSSDDEEQGKKVTIEEYNLQRHSYAQIERFNAKSIGKDFNPNDLKTANLEGLSFRKKKNR